MAEGKAGGVGKRQWQWVLFDSTRLYVGMRVGHDLGFFLTDIVSCCEMKCTKPEAVIEAEALRS